MFNDKFSYEGSRNKEIRKAKFLGPRSILFKANKRSLWFTSIKKVMSSMQDKYEREPLCLDCFQHNGQILSRVPWLLMSLVTPGTEKFYFWSVAIQIFGPYIFFRAGNLYSPLFFLIWLRFSLSFLSFNSSWWCKNKERKPVSLEICLPIDFT